MPKLLDKLRGKGRKSKDGEVSRSAESGQFVSKDEAKKNPKTTVTEKVKRTVSRSKKRSKRNRAKQVIDVNGKQVEATSYSKCPHCNGTGLDFTDNNKTCQSCKGFGRVTTDRKNEVQEAREL